MTKLLDYDELSILVDRVRGDLDLSKFLHENPLRNSYQVIGATRGLELPAKALAELAGEFSEELIWIMGIDERRVDEALGLEIDVEHMGEIGNAVFNIPNSPNVFTCDLVVAFGDSRSWFAFFDAELSLGLLVVKREEHVQRALDAYGKHDVVLSVLDGFRSSIEDEVEPYLPDAKEIADALYFNWKTENWGQSRIS